MGSFRKLLAVDVFKLQCRRPAIAARELYHRWPQSIFYLPVEPRDFTCAKLLTRHEARRIAANIVNRLRLPLSQQKLRQC
jgi:hypothetical protein